MRLTCLLTALVLVASSARAQGGAEREASVSMPAMGYFYDAPAGAIRPLHGIPGAGMIGAAIPLPFPVLALAVSQRSGAALAVSAETRQVRLIRLGGAYAAADIPDAMAPDRIAFSASGTAAVLYQRDSGRVQTITGIPARPIVFDVPAPAFEEVQDIAISDDGEWVLVASRPAWLLRRNGAASSLPLPAAVAAFHAGTHDALLASENGDVFLLRNAGAGFRQIDWGGRLTASPAGLQFSPDGLSAYVATKTGNILEFDLETGAFASASCACVPSGLEPLRFPALFRLNEPSGSAMWLFDGSRPAAPRVWFVPPGPEALNPRRSRQ